MHCWRQWRGEPAPARQNHAKQEAIGRSRGPEDGPAVDSADFAVQRKRKLAPQIRKHPHRTFSHSLGHSGRSTDAHRTVDIPQQAGDPSDFGRLRRLIRRERALAKGRSAEAKGQLLNTYRAAHGRTMRQLRLLADHIKQRTTIEKCAVEAPSTRRKRRTTHYVVSLLEWPFWMHGECCQRP